MNTPIECNQEAGPGNQDCAPSCPRRGLSRLQGFSARQLQHINAWLDEGVSYRKIAEHCRTEFQIEVPHMTIARYYKRRLPRTLLDLADSKESAAEISKYAATGDASFSATTLEILEQLAFDLALAFSRDSDAEDLATLKNLWGMINKAKNTAIRDRHATVQEKKCALRAEEVALKRELGRTHHSTAPADRPALDPVEDLSSSIKLFDSVLPPEVLENNALYSRKLSCGEVRHITAPGTHIQTEYCNPADKPAFANNENARYVPEDRPFFLPPLRRFGPLKADSQTALPELQT